MRIDTNDDGSMIFGRALGVLGAWDALAPGLKARARPGERSAIRRMRRRIAAAEPLLSRTARIS